VSLSVGWIAALVLAQAGAGADAGDAPVDAAAQVEPDAAADQAADGGLDAAADAPGVADPPPALGPEREVDDPVLTGATGEQTAAQSAWDGKQLLVTWRSSLWRNELRAARLSPDGQVLDPRGVPVAALDRADGHGAVAAGPDGFLIGWVQEPSALVVARAAAPPGAGLTIGPPVTVWPGAGDSAASSPALAAVGGEFWMTWTQSGGQPGLMGARLSAAGAPLAPPERLGDGDGATALLRMPGPGGDRTFLLYAVRVGEMIEVRLAPLSAEARPSPLPRILWQLPGVTALGAALVAGGDQMLAAVAVMGADGKSEVRARRLNASGMELGEAATALATGVVLRGGPSAAWDGQAFRVAWATELKQGERSESRLASARVATDGTVSAAEPPGVSQAGRAPHLATGAPWMLWEEVNWWGANNEPFDTDLRAVRLDGPAAASSTLVSAGPNWQTEPAVASNGEQVMVVFEDRREDKPGADIYAARITPEGEPIDRAARPLGVGPAVQREPQVAWDGTNFVVVWHEGLRGLVLARVSREGEVLDRPPVVIPGTEQQQFLSNPAICGDGDGALIVWNARKDEAPLPPAPQTREAELRALRLPAGAGPQDGTSLLLTKTADLAAASVRIGCNPKAALIAWSGRVNPDRPPALYLGRLLRGWDKLDLRPGLVELQRGVSDEEPGIATDGAGFLVSWRSIYRGQRTVWGMRLDGDGYLLDSPAIEIGTSNSGLRTTASWDGQQYLVTTVHTQDDLPFQLRGRRVSADGLVPDRQWFPLAQLARTWGGGGAGCAALATGPGRTLLVYEQYAGDDAASNPRIRSRVLTTPLALRPDSPDAADAAIAAEASPAPDGAPDVSPADLGTDGPSPARASGGGGCGCQVGGPPTAPAAALLAALGLLVMRPRRRPRRR
jgi:MYXO-CTERM domain-containing protein